MTTFAITYSIVWLALVLYVVRLAARQRKLNRMASVLVAQIEESEQLRQRH